MNNYKHSILFLKIETGKLKFVEGIQSIIELAYAVGRVGDFFEKD